MKSKRSMSSRAGVTSAAQSTAPARSAEANLPVSVPEKPAISPEVRHEMIACAAYYRAEKRGFSGGSELDDWLAAEAEVDRTLSGAEIQYH